MITLSKTHLSKLKSHGIDAYPEECCGAMLGHIDYKKNEKKTVKLIKIENNSDENKHRRFKITPQDYQTLEKQAKDEGLTLLGFYHTHPDHPCKPSQTDLNYAWPFFSYIILSVEKQKPAQIKSFVLEQKGHQFDEEKLVFE